MKDLKTIESRVRVILSNHKEARDDDMILYLLYCNRYGEVKIGYEQLQGFSYSLLREYSSHPSENSGGNARTRLQPQSTQSEKKAARQFQSLCYRQEKVR